jgi:predicted methyltransferase
MFCKNIFIYVLAIALISITSSAFAQNPPAYATAAVADSSRPAEQRADDAARMPATVIAFAMVKPGSVVAEVRPGRGYYTRIISKAVGANGKLYSIDSAERVEARPNRMDGIKAIADEAGYSNIEVKTPAFATLAEVGEPLESGGYYFILDHAAQVGTGLSATDTIHRIDPEAVKEQILAAGFVLDAEGDALERANDDRTTQGKFENSQFMLRFRKP